VEYYLILILSTVVIFFLAWAIYSKTRTIGYPLAIAFLYYWSLYGAWWIVYDRRGGWSGFSYGYLDRRLFPVHLDDSYFWAVVLYATFVVATELGLLLSVSSAKVRLKEARAQIAIYHPAVLLITASAGILSYLIIRPYVSLAWESYASGYVMTRSSGSESRFFTLHQVLSRAALVPAALGFAVWCSGKEARFITGRGPRWSGLGYLLVLGGMFCFSLVIGYRSDLVFAGVSGWLFYLANSMRHRFVLVAAWPAAGLLGLWLVEILRAFPLSELLPALLYLKTSDLLSAVHSFKSSNEAFAAHFSMYGVLAEKVAPTYGYSLLSLAASAIPRVLWPSRPADIYYYYAESVGAVPGQGYTLHHATAWYLNFGVPGVVIGGMLLGWVLAKCFNSYVAATLSGSRWRYVLSILAPWTSIGCMPTVLRAGPEAYKGLIIEGFLIPSLLLAFASLRCRQIPRGSKQSIRRTAIRSKCF